MSQREQPIRRPIDSTYRNAQGQPVEGPNNPTPNTRIDTTLENNQPLEPQLNNRATSSETDDAMARSESWADGTITRTSTGNTRADQARKTKPDDID